MLRPIAEDKSRVALIRFSSNHSTDVEFHLGDYNNVLSVLNHIGGGVPYVDGIVDTIQVGPNSAVNSMSRLAFGRLQTTLPGPVHFISCQFQLK